MRQKRGDAKIRPAQGKRLRDLRLAAGLSQSELARMVGVAQPNIAFWEQNEKPPRSDVLPKMAVALGVRIEDILVSGKAVAPRQGGPTGKVREVFEQVSRLPRRQQRKVVEFVSAFVKQYEQNKQD